MIYSSLAILAVAASAAMPSLGTLVHMHPRTADDRVRITLVNKSTHFDDVKIDGRSYTVLPGTSVSIKAPAGTLILRDSPVPFHAKGEVLVQLTTEMNDRIVDVNS